MEPSLVSSPTMFLFERSSSLLFFSPSGRIFFSKKRDVFFFLFVSAGVSFKEFLYLTLERVVEVDVKTRTTKKYNKLTIE